MVSQMKNQQDLLAARTGGGLASSWPCFQNPAHCFSVSLFSSHLPDFEFAFLEQEVLSQDVRTTAQNSLAVEV